MDPAWADLAKDQAPLVVLLLLILWTGMRGTWVWKSAVEEYKKEIAEGKAEREKAISRVLEIHEQRLVTKDTEHREQMAACRDDVTLMRAERDEWKGLALKALATSESAVLHAEVRQGEHS